MFLDYIASESCNVKDELRVLTSEYGIGRKMFTTDLSMCRALILFSESVVDKQILMHIPQKEIPGLDASLNNLLDQIKMMFENAEGHIVYTSRYSGNDGFSDINEALKRQLKIEAIPHKSEKKLIDVVFDSRERLICEATLNDIMKTPAEYARELMRIRAMPNGNHIFVPADNYNLNN
jgi:hypothetical protein